MMIGRSLCVLTVVFLLQETPMVFAKNTTPQCTNYKILDEQFRSIHTKVIRIARCDDAIMNNTWYRFTGKAGTMMPTSYVPNGRCGTEFPGWVQGTHPHTVNTTSAAMVCFDVNKKQTCGRQVSIKITNCDGFYVYKLPQMANCTETKVYCGVNGTYVTFSPTQPVVPTTKTMPSQCSSYNLLGQLFRNVHTKYTPTGIMKSWSCDNTITDNAWYRFTGQAGIRMPSTYVPRQHCSTEAPGWVRGNHPQHASTSNSAIVCFDVRNDKTCGEQVNIEITNCATFYIYRLPRITNCSPNKVYCGTNGTYTEPSTLAPSVLPTTRTISSIESSEVVTASSVFPSPSVGLVTSIVSSDIASAGLSIVSSQIVISIPVPSIVSSNIATASAVLSIESSQVASSPEIATSIVSSIPPSEMATSSPIAIFSNMVTSNAGFTTAPSEIPTSTPVVSTASPSIATSRIESSIASSVKATSSPIVLAISSNKATSNTGFTTVPSQIPTLTLVVSTPSPSIAISSIDSSIPLAISSMMASSNIVTSSVDTETSSLLVSTAGPQMTTYSLVPLPTTSIISTFPLPSSSPVFKMSTSSLVLLPTTSKISTSLLPSSSSVFKLVTSSLPFPTTTSKTVTPSLIPTTTKAPEKKTTEGPYYCPEDEQDGILWRRTEAGKSTSQDCPKGHGMAERFCSQSGWKDTNATKQCRSAEIGQLFDKVTSKLNDSSLSKEERRATAEEIVKELANATNLDDKDETKRLTENDLVTSVNILSGIVKLNISNASLSITKTVSNILNPKNKKTWDVVENPTKVVSNLVVSMDDYGFQVGRNLINNKNDANITQTSTNVELRVKLVQPGSVSTTEYSPSTFQNSSFDLSPSVFRQNSTAVVVLVNYKTLHSVLREKTLTKEGSEGKENDTEFEINSEIISASVWPEPPDVLEKPVRITWKDKQEKVGSSSKCVFWKPESSTNVWSTRGCKKVEENVAKGRLICECNHMTAFAAMDISDGLLSKAERASLEIISTIGCSLSLLGVLLTIVCYIVLWKRLHPSSMTEVRPRVLMHLCVAVGMTDVLAIVAGPAHSDKEYCTVVSILLLYFVLAVFGWMLCEGIVIYLQLVRVFSGLGGRHLRVFYAIGWVAPAVVVGISASCIDTDAFITEHACWFRATGALLWIFVAATASTLVANVVVFFCVLKNMLSSHSLSQASAINKARAGVKATAVLLPLLGLTWVFGLLVFNRETIFFKYLFAIFNSLQGLMIFVCHVLINKQIQDVIKKQRKTRKMMRSMFDSHSHPTTGKSITTSISDTSVQTRTSSLGGTPLPARHLFGRSKGYLKPLVLTNKTSTMTEDTSLSSSPRSNEYLPETLSLRSNGFLQDSVVRNNGFMHENCLVSDGFVEENSLKINGLFLDSKTNGCYPENITLEDLDRLP